MTPEDISIAELVADMRQLDGRPFTVQIGAFAAYALLGVIQLAWRHPGLSEMEKDLILRVGEQLEQGITSAGASELIQATMAMGWNVAHDR